MKRKMLFRKRCAYCGMKIDKGKEVFRDVKVPGFTGTKRKAFVSEEHAERFEEETKKQSKRPSMSCH